MRAAVAATVPPPLAALAAAAKLCEPHVPPCCCCVQDAGLGEGDAAREDAFQSCSDSSSSSSVPHAGLFSVVEILDGVFMSAPALVTRSFLRSRSSARTRAFSSRRPFSRVRARHALTVPSNARSPSAPTTPLSLLRQSQRRHLPGCVKRYLQRRRRSASIEPALAASTRITMLSGNAAYAPKCEDKILKSSGWRKIGRPEAA